MFSWKQWVYSQIREATYQAARDGVIDGLAAASAEAGLVPGSDAGAISNQLRSVIARGSTPPHPAMGGAEVVTPSAELPPAPMADIPPDERVAKLAKTLKSKGRAGAPPAGDASPDGPGRPKQEEQP